jgi:hypothetical protein
VDEPDLDEVVRRANVYRCALPVGLILDRACRLVDASIPDEVVRSMTPASLRAVDRGVCRLVDPVQFDERPTITRAFARSVRSSLVSTVVAVPMRATRWVRRQLVRPRPNESDSPDEKASYLRAVMGASH